MDSSKTPPHWRRPEDVMRLHKLRMKKRALNFRCSDKPNKDSENNEETTAKKNIKRNPFKRFESEPNEIKKTKFNANEVDDLTTDGTLFRLLNFSQSHKDSQSETQNLSFSNALLLLNSPQSSQKNVECKGKFEQTELPIDWTLRIKVRLMSTQPFPWNQKLKTCEEASGITGFVRCINTQIDSGKINLDTSPNARFHQCCLIWQHPVLPWLDLYPRIGKKSSAISSVPLTSVKDNMYKTWLNGFRSLFQLVRAKQCPYFYLITNTFVCLFRAAGINGYSEINASVTPTTRGFRQLLKEEDIEFSMPLKVKENKSPVTNDSTDTGYESIDVNEDFDDLKDNICDNDDDDDDDETDQWLENMGMGDDIKKLNSSEKDSIIGRERIIDDLPESLIFVEGVEAHAFFNFLVNCKSIVSTSGYFAGVPPTLLAPIAFTGASLTPLKVRESEITQNETCYHSMEITGPILPHTIHNLCDLMKNSNLDKFSLTFADIKSTQAFTAATAHDSKISSLSSTENTPRTPSIFDEQNLSDCGLKSSILTKFCKSEVSNYDSIKYSDSLYSYS